MKSSITREWFSTHLAEDIAFEMDHPFPVGGRGRPSPPVAVPHEVRAVLSMSRVLTVVAKTSALPDYTTLKEKARVFADGFPGSVTMTASTHAA